MIVSILKSVLTLVLLYFLAVIFFKLVFSSFTLIIVLALGIFIGRKLNKRQYY